MALTSRSSPSIYTKQARTGHASVLGAAQNAATRINRRSPSLTHPKPRLNPKPPELGVTLTETELRTEAADVEMPRTPRARGTIRTVLGTHSPSPFLARVQLPIAVGQRIDPRMRVCPTRARVYEFSHLHGFHGTQDAKTPVRTSVDVPRGRTQTSPPKDADDPAQVVQLSWSVMGRVQLRPEQFLRRDVQTGL